MDSEDKQRVSLYLDKETVKTVDVFIKKHGYRSRNEFFETAAKNMIADSALKSSDDILSDKLAKAIENVSEDNAKAISKGLFRYAVQLEMLMRVIAKTNHFTDDELEEKELIETERTLVENREGALRNGNLMYKILPIKQAVDAFHRRQLYNYGRKK